MNAIAAQLSHLRLDSLDLLSGPNAEQLVFYVFGFFAVIGLVHYLRGVAL